MNSHGHCSQHMRRFRVSSGRPGRTGPVAGQAFQSEADCREAVHGCTRMGWAWQLPAFPSLSTVFRTARSSQRGRGRRRPCRVGATPQFHTVRSCPLETLNSQLLIPDCERALCPFVGFTARIRTLESLPSGLKSFAALTVHVPDAVGRGYHGQCRRRRMLEIRMQDEQCKIGCQRASAQ